MTLKEEFEKEFDYVGWISKTTPERIVVWIEEKIRQAECRKLEMDEKLYNLGRKNAIDDAIEIAKRYVVINNPPAYRILKELQQFQGLEDKKWT